MASCSSSSPPAKTSYDVFLSFRGADTRDNFTSHLYAALCREKIETFIDNELNRGEEIEQSLMKVIEESEISVIIFSNGYASSPWCLDELVKILECRKTLNRVVLPVFYSVDPSDVEGQTGIFGEAFRKLESEHKDNMDKWRNALKEATTLSGWDSKNHRPDSVLLDVFVKVVKGILNQLYRMSSVDSSGFVGIESHIEKIQSLLSIGSGGIRCIGILGMGGIGKSTCAEVLYHRISHKYDGCCFLANVRENLEKHTLIFLKEKMISQIFKDERVHIDTPNALHISTKRKLKRIKVLIVLDDVNEVKQLDDLVGNEDWLGSGSRIIITSRDRRVFKSKMDEIYKVEGLCDFDAFQLFSLNAFKQKFPPLDYELCESIVNHAKGVPLVIKVLGTHLCNSSQNEWKIVLDKIKKFPDPEIQKVLEISYEELEKSEKDIFLDIACFFKGYEKKFVENILNSCNFNASWGIIRLVDKCLVTIMNGKLQMHDLIQEMGWNIAKRNHSRFWDSTDICNILSANKEAIEGMSLDMMEVGRKVNLNLEDFLGMDNLRILKICNSNSTETSFMQEFSWSDYVWSFVSKNKSCSQCLLNKLILLHWEFYPFKSLPSNFGVHNLVELKMPHSRLEQLWNGNKFAQKLKRIDLSFCFNLKRLPDLSAATNLELIDLTWCSSLLQVSSSIQKLYNLDSLILNGCTKLQKIPSLVQLKSLKKLDLSRCYNLKILPEIPSGIQMLHMEKCQNLLSLPVLVHLNSLTLLDLSDCSKMKMLPDLPRGLIWLYLSNTANLKMLPDLPRGLEELKLSESGLEECPPSIRYLRNLKVLEMSNCKNLRSLPSSIELNSLEELHLGDLWDADMIPKINGINVKILKLDKNGIQELPSSVVCLSSLVELTLRGCVWLESLPSNICELSCLKELNLNGCSKLGKLPPLYGLSSLENLYLDGTAVLNIPTDIGSLSSLKVLSVNTCERLQGLPKLPEGLRYLQAFNCTSMETAEKSLSFTDIDDLDGRCGNYGFNYCNCYNLDRRSRFNIVEDSLLRIKRIAMANEYSDFIVGLPGSEVPEQFEYQGEGSSISFMLPPHYDERDLVFAFCAVVEFEASLVNLDSLRLHCSRFSEKGHEKNVYCNLWFLDEWVPESDHVFIWYQRKSNLRNINEVSFQFTCKDLDKELNIKKCGVTFED